MRLFQLLKRHKKTKEINENKVNETSVEVKDKIKVIIKIIMIK